MRKLRKILFWTAGIVVGLVLLFLVGFRLFFPMEKAKAYALEKATAALGRDVTIESVDLSLLGGLGVRLGGIEVGNPPGFSGEGAADPFLRAESVDLKVQLRPLLGGKVRGDRLVINAPRIRALKRADGTDNFTFASADSATGGSAGESDEAAPLDASIDRIEINDGDVEFRDEVAGVAVRVNGLRLRSTLGNPAPDILQAEGTLETDSLRVTAEQPVPPLAPRAEFAVRYDQKAKTGALERLDLEVAGIPLSMTGTFGGSGEAFTARGRLAAERITAEQLLALVPQETLDALQDLAISGEATLNCDLDLSPAREVPLEYTARCTVKDLAVEPRNASANLVIAAAAIEVVPDSAVIDITEGTAGGEPFTGHVEIVDFLHPRFDGRLQGAIDLALAQPFLDPALEAELGGRATFETTFAGPVEDPDLIEASGTLVISGLRLAAAPLPETIEKLDGTIDFDRRTIRLQGVQARTASSDFTLDGTLRDPLPYFLPPELRDEAPDGPLPTVEFSLRSGRLDIDRLFPPASPGAEAAAGMARNDSVALPEFPDISGGGTVTVDTLVYSQVEFTSITADVEIGNRTVTCRNAQAAVYSGSVTGETAIDLGDMNHPRYTGRFDAQQIQVQDFLARFTRFDGLFYGEFNLDGTFDAAGIEPDAIRNSLTFDSLAKMKEGRLSTSGFAYEALNGLAAKLGQTLEPNQELKNLSTAIRTENGRVILDELATGLGSLGELKLAGSYGFSGDVEFAGSLLLSQSRTRSLLESAGLTGKIANLVAGSGGGDTPGRIALPLTVGGTLTKPSMKVDYAALTKAASENLKENVKDDLQDKVGDKLKDLFK